LENAGEDTIFQVGSGDAYVDAGFSRAEAADLRAREACIRKIAKVKALHGWTQTELGRRIGMPQSEVSLLLRGKVSRFSLDRLIAALTDLGVGVHITLVDDVQTGLVVVNG
jgi:predicted XRE-type DNA-binding protein